MTLSTVSRVVTPSWLARSRRSRGGVRVIDVLRHEHIAHAGQGPRLPRDLEGDGMAWSRSMPPTWMSSGAGMPRLRMASTRPPVWK